MEMLTSQTVLLLQANVCVVAFSLMKPKNIAREANQQFHNHIIVTSLRLSNDYSAKAKT